MPFVHPERRLNMGGELAAYDDELPLLHRSGIRAVLCLLNIPSDARVYKASGFRFHLCPIDDGAPPTFEQADRSIGFIKQCLQDGLPIAVHCEGGVGRTGTILAAWFIASGQTASQAIDIVRGQHPCAIETNRQICFLEDYEHYLVNKPTS